MLFSRRRLAGKRVLVTGASGGIGRAVALAAARKGAIVLAAARSEDRLQKLAEEAAAEGFRIVPVVADVTDANDRRRMIETAVSQFGGLDVLVNNAGVGAFGHFIDLSPEILRQVFEVNFFATAETCREAIPVLAKADQPLIVNVSSMTGRRAIPAWTDYSASKYAVVGFSEALRAELVRFDIHLMLVVPGLTRSDLGMNLLANKGRALPKFEKAMPTSAVADRIVGAMQRNVNELRIEWNARWLLFANRLCPRIIDAVLARIVRRLYPKQQRANQ